MRRATACLASSAPNPETSGRTDVTSSAAMTDGPTSGSKTSEVRAPTSLPEPYYEEGRPTVMGARSRFGPEIPSRFVPVRSADQVKRGPRSQTPDQGTQGQLEPRVPPQLLPRPPHQREQRRGQEAPGAEHGHKADERTSGARGVQRELEEGREEGEGHGRERVGEEDDAQLGRSAEERDEEPGPGVQPGDDP